MRAKVNDIELTERERGWLAQAVAPDEVVHLLLRPRTEPQPGQFTWERIFGSVWLLLCLGMTVGLMEGPDPRAGLLSLPVWLAGIGTLCWPRLWRLLRQRTLYVLTARRVVLREPVAVFFSRTRVFKLHAEMIQEVGVLPGGYGNIVLGYAWDERNGAREERVARQVGLMDIPRVKYVQSVLELAIEECRS